MFRFGLEHVRVLGFVFGRSEFVVLEMRNAPPMMLQLKSR